VQLARRVQGAHALDELAEGGPQLHEVRRGLRARREIRVGDRHLLRRGLSRAAPGGLHRDHRGAGAVVGLRPPGLLHVLDEVAALDELHREEDLAVFAGDQLVQVNEVGVKDVRERPEFLLESIEADRVEVEHRLEGEPLVLLPVEHFVDDPHPPATEAPEDLEARGAPPRGDDSRCLHRDVLHHPLIGHRSPSA
jgi:hypothetical protein